MTEPAIHTASLDQALAAYKAELDDELYAILSWWIRHARDKKQQGFYGKVRSDNTPDLLAPKGLVLHSRILWTFSAACRHTNNPLYKEIADEVFAYLISCFSDQQWGGMVWSVDPAGTPADGKKQTYGLAFAVYGLSEYYKMSQETSALEKAKEIYYLIEKNCYDNEYGGYYEAFGRDWHPIEDMRLSEKEMNEKKTMNTHLHIIEAYASLYTAWSDAGLKDRLLKLLAVFDERILDKESGRQYLFFENNWKVKSAAVSYGHDIEASWLLQECAEIAGDEKYIRLFRKMAVRMTEAAAGAIDGDGALWYEYDTRNAHYNKEKHWWVQAEAMVGFLNAWQVSNEETYLARSLATWTFVKGRLKDSQGGEWWWGIAADGTIMKKEDKAGFWKCPYHNGRACLEIIKRIDAYLSGKGNKPERR